MNSSQDHARTGSPTVTAPQGEAGARRRPGARPAPRAGAGLAAALLALLPACASDSLHPDHAGARALLQEVTGQREVHDPDGPPLAPGAVSAALTDGLGLEEALRLALLNNRRLRAAFDTLGMARADVVQAGLLENPSLGLSFLFPSGDALVRAGANFSQSLTELWHLDERQEVAEADYQQRLLALGQLAGELVADTRRAYLECVAAAEQQALADARVDLARSTLELAETSQRVGVSTALEVAAARGALLADELAARDVALRSTHARRELAASLSLNDELMQVPLLDGLPPALAPPGSREQAVLAARAQRLDRRALLAAVEAAELRLELEYDHRAPHVSGGVGYERPESSTPTDHVLGPTASVELPLFDRNQAGISRALYELQRTRHQLEALDAELSQKVRAAWDRAAVTAASARFAETELVPQAERSAELADGARRRGDLTAERALDAARTTLDARATALAARREAALARGALELALGRPLASATEAGAETAASTSTAPATTTALSAPPPHDEPAPPH